MDPNFSAALPIEAASSDADQGAAAMATRAGSLSSFAVRRLLERKGHVGSVPTRGWSVALERKDLTPYGARCVSNQIVRARMKSVNNIKKNTMQIKMGATSNLWTMRAKAEKFTRHVATIHSAPRGKAVHHFPKRTWWPGLAS